MNTKVNKMVTYKITIQESIAFLQTSDNLLEYVMRNDQFTIVAKSIKKTKNKLCKNMKVPCE